MLEDDTDWKWSLWEKIVKKSKMANFLLVWQGAIESPGHTHNPMMLQYWKFRQMWHIFRICWVLGYVQVIQQLTISL